VQPGNSTILTTSTVTVVFGLAVGSFCGGKKAESSVKFGMKQLNGDCRLKMRLKMIF
jgi:hypothetical protein